MDNCLILLRCICASLALIVIELAVLLTMFVEAWGPK